MITYYERGGVVITDRAVVVDGESFQVTDLGALTKFLPTWWAFRLRLRTGRYELWAEHRTVQTLIFTTRNERIFGQVCRAVTRATECRDRRRAANF